MVSEPKNEKLSQPESGMNPSHDQSARKDTASAAQLEIEKSKAEQAFFAGGADDATADHGGQTDDDVDPELVRLPRSRRWRRHPVISAVVIALSLYLMYFLRDDLSFFFQPRKPHDVGDAAVALKQGRLKPNTHIKLSGAPDRKHALVLEGRFGGYDQFFRLLQTQNKVFVQIHREQRSTDDEITAEHSGQLIHYAVLPYAKSLAQHLAKTRTMPHDFSFAALTKAKTSAKGTSTAQDQHGETVALNPDTLVWINAALPDEWFLQLKKQEFVRQEDAARQVAMLGVPAAADEEESTLYWRFVVHVEPDQMPLLKAKLKNDSIPAELLQRQLSYSARWDQLSIAGQRLIIEAADPTFPTRYQVNTTDREAAALVPIKETKVSLPAEAILYLSTSTPFVIIPEAFVLLTDRRPGDNWYYALLYLLLLTFILVNGAALWQRLRASTKAAQPTTGQEI